MVKFSNCQSQWPHLTRRESAAAWLLGLRVRIPLSACIYSISLVSVVGCKVEVASSCWPVVQSSPTECGVSVIVNRRLRGGPGPLAAVAP
jgi:hypothetical protein